MAAISGRPTLIKERKIILLQRAKITGPMPSSDQGMHVAKAIVVFGVGSKRQPKQGELL
jgi:hypothetical protein